MKTKQTLNIRKRFNGNELPKLQNECANAWAAAMGNEPFPADLSEAAATLKSLLQASVPESAGVPGPNFIQQFQDFQDFHEFTGFIDDLEVAFGKDYVTVASDRSSNVKLAKVQHPTEDAVQKAVARKEDTAG